MGKSTLIPSIPGINARWEGVEDGVSVTRSKIKVTRTHKVTTWQQSRYHV